MTESFHCLAPRLAAACRAALPALCRLAALLCLVAPAHAQGLLADRAVVVTERVRAELVAHAPQGVAAGKPVRLGLLLRHQPHWHTYWKNPGDSGLPTSFDWRLPPGVAAGEIEWPTPKPLPVGPLVNFGYDGEVLLPVSLTPPDGFAAPALEVALHADWLVCKDICVPESGDFRLRVPAQAATVAHAALFEATRAFARTSGSSRGRSARAVSNRAAWPAVAACAGTRSLNSPDSGTQMSLQTSQSACSAASRKGGCAAQPAGTPSVTGSSTSPS